MFSIQEYLKLFPHLYYRLILLVGKPSFEKHELLKALQSQISCDYVNLNYSLSEKLIQIPINERCFYVQDFINEIIDDKKREILLIENTEILFEKHLKIDPLMMLKNISRHRNTIASWSGSVKQGYLTYAEPNHPDYARYKVIDTDFIIIESDEILTEH